LHPPDSRFSHAGSFAARQFGSSFYSSFPAKNTQIKKSLYFRHKYLM
jgi:hypothetical protein